MLFRLLLVPILLAVILLSAMIFMNLKLVHNENLQFELIKNQSSDLIKTKLERLFDIFQAKLRERSETYISTHRNIEKRFHSVSKSNLADLKEEFSTRLGFNIDLYYVDDDYVIRQSTFEPDIGLDFKSEYFPDAQAVLKKAELSGGVVVGVPGQEFVSRQYKIYSVSKLDTGGYLEVGFIDPQIGILFKNIRDVIESLDVVESVSIYFDNAGQSLIPLGNVPFIDDLVKGNLSKYKMMKEVEEQLAEDYEVFKSVSSDNPVDSYNEETPYQQRTLYLELDSDSLSPNFSYRYLAKIELIYPIDSWFEKHSGNLGVLAGFLTLALLLYAYYELKFRVISPLKRLQVSIQDERPVDIPDSDKLSKNILFLLESYNRRLKKIRELSTQLETTARTDSLTNLFNRRALEDVHTRVVGNAARNKKLLAVAFLDLDHFKEYNDAYGHQAGDEVLCTFSEIIREKFRRPNDSAIRYGGEEFVIYFEADSFDGACGQVKTLKNALENRKIPHIDNPPYKVLTVSIGLAVYDCPGLMTSQEVIKPADDALYEAKDSGRNKVICRHYEKVK